MKRLLILPVLLFACEDKGGDSGVTSVGTTGGTTLTTSGGTTGTTSGGTTSGGTTSGGTSGTTTPPEQTLFTYEGNDTLVIDVEVREDGSDLVDTHQCVGSVTINIDQVNGTNYAWSWEGSKGGNPTQGDPTGFDLIGVGDCEFSDWYDAGGDLIEGKGMMLADFDNDTDVSGNMFLLIDTTETERPWSGQLNGNTVSGEFSGQVSFQQGPQKFIVDYSGSWSADKI